MNYDFYRKRISQSRGPVSVQELLQRGAYFSAFPAGSLIPEVEASSDVSISNSSSNSSTTTTKLLLVVVAVAKAAVVVAVLLLHYY
jgi:hypothetical protein